MQLVILHYHLNRGGVTSVIENHLRSLATLEPQAVPTQVTIVYGGRAAAWNHEVAQELPFECSLLAVPELEYDHLRSSETPLHEALQSVLRQFDRNSTVLHVHNHCLGKNAEMASTVSRLAEDGWRLLLQIHDFAEDLRPANYQHLVNQADSKEQLQGQLYPQAAQIHYAVLNGRDHQVLTTAGIGEERLHLLPNPVKAPQHSSDRQLAQTTKDELAETLGFPVEHQFVLYPVRAIRRKNIGEFLLWSLLTQNATFAVSLAPLNPQEAANYQQWVEFATELQLPVLFDTGSKTDLPFEAVYAAADAIITTSVAEGFGMVFLEASLAGRRLVGRELPAVCSDFLAAGMLFPGLSEVMAIPADRIDLAELRQCHRRLSEDLRTAYGLPAASPEELGSIDTTFSGDTLDFARLESNQQQSFLRQVKAEADLRRTLCELNPAVQTIGALTIGARTIGAAADDLDSILQSNCRVIAENYSPAVIGEQLSHIYRSILTSDLGPVENHPTIASSILACFVHPRQLFPIRLES